MFLKIVNLFSNFKRNEKRQKAIKIITTFYLTSNDMKVHSIQKVSIKQTSKQRTHFLFTF